MAIKTQATQVSVEDFIASLPDDQQQDSRQLIKIMQDITNYPPVMWGNSIVGFDSYHYKSQRSSQEGDWMKIGFAPRQGKISLYLTTDAEQLTRSLQDVGKYQTGKGCIYIKKLADVDRDKLVQLIKIAYLNAPSG